MKTITVDASAAAAWLFPSQATQRSVDFIKQIEDYNLIAPHIFVWEVGNLIAVRARRGQITVREGLSVLDDIGIDIAASVSEHSSRALIPSAVKAAISVFDAAYVELAIMTEGGLVSRDRNQLTYAAAFGVEVFDLNDTPH